MIKFAAMILCAGAFFIAASPIYAARGTTMLPGTVKNFELPNFDDATGAKQWELFGDDAKYVNDARIDIGGMKLDLYEGRGNPVLKATIKSPTASVNPETKIAESRSPINVKGDAFDIDGKIWKWNGEKKLIEVFSDVKILVKPSDKKTPDTILTGDYASFNHGGVTDIFVMRGNVSVKNPDTDMACASLEMFKGKNDGEISKISASGGVKMLRDKRDCRAESADIVPSKRLAALYGKPEIVDLPSGARLSGAVIMLDGKVKKAVSLSDENIRANTVFFHTDENGKPQKITVNSDKVIMVSQTERNLFNFVGNVKIHADDFDARCDILAASAKNDETGGRREVEYIRGNGGVKFSNADGTATGAKIEIIPSKSEIWLADGARLDNPARGTVLTADIMVFFRKQNRGFAFSNTKKNPDSRVVAKIAESADIGGGAGVGRSSAGKSETLIKSRTLNFSRTADSMNFAFVGDVSVKSDETDAVCRRMQVFATTENGSASIKKIDARDGVVVKQKGYTAESEIAEIYPRLKVKGAENSISSSHKYVELFTSPDNPGRRPTITLPPLGNLGIKDSVSAKKTESAPTVITSDRQWLTGSVGGDKYYFEGDVHAVGTDMKASCGKIEVRMRAPRKNAKKEITKIVMTDSVKLEQSLKEIHCGRADIYADEEMVVFSDNPVVLNREDNTRASGYRIVYNKGAENVVVENSPDASKNNTFAQPLDDDLDSPAKRPTIVLPTNKK